MALVLLFGACSTSTAESADPQAKGLSQLTTVTPSTSMSTPTLRPTSESSSTVATPTPPSVSTTAAEEAAAQAVLDRSQAWRDCTADIEACNESVFALTSTGPMLDVLIETLAHWRTRGYAVLPPINPDHHEDEIVDVIVSAEGGIAFVTHCQVDGTRLVDTGAGPDGSDVIVDDRILTTFARYTIKASNDGIWRVETVELLKQGEGAVGCDSNAS